ncbi:MAG: DUF3160 domain-containing protein [Polyangiaceae bacterium]
MREFCVRRWSVWVGVIAVGACAGQGRQAPPSERAARPAQVAANVAMPAARSARPDVGRSYRAHLAKQPNLEFSDLERELSLARKADAPLSFDPGAARYAALAQDRLNLSPEERDAFRRDGVVNVDHQQRYSMGAAYYAVFTRDLPVLVTTDSILHAFHRSYDTILQGLETAEFTSVLRTTLEKSHESLRRIKVTTPKLQASAADVDLYLTVARNLLSNGPVNPNSSEPLAVPSLLGNDAQVRVILSKIAALKLETRPEFSELYGGRRPIDYSQFKPRGHYSESPELARYFRAMMWLSRADTGFVLAPPDKNSGISADAERELRSAILLASIVEQSGELARFEAMAQSIDFLVGSADNLTLQQLLKALRDAGIQGQSALEQTGSVVALQQQVALAGQQQIRAQVLTPPRHAEKEAEPPALFQLFGQRFLLDSFLLSRLVYDSIFFKGKKMERQMPSGLDVMAALGNDEATRLLRPELEQFKYSSNLLAARRTVADIRPDEFEQSVASLWLDSLRKLDDVPVRGNFPEAMRRTPFLRKQLQTQLASWAELRHDTELYGKQSYSAGISCEYPEGYVEPYPEFFARLALLCERAGQRLAALGTSKAGYAEFFANFANTMKYLEILAQKELDGQPFSAEESGFLKKTIDSRGFGCGPPHYDGWYASLFFDESPALWKPTVSDVHTDPTSGQVLQEGVGDANFMLLAVDNQRDRAVYVGPVYSYYEFTRSAFDRLTDEQWRDAIQRSALPARPAWWTSAFPAPAQARKLAPMTGKPKESDPRALAAQRLAEQVASATGEERERLTRELRLQLEAASKPPLSPAK